jgi:hypothetical protein
MMITFEDFLSLYLSHLAAPDQPTCFVAYCRAEADVIVKYGERRYANSKTWRSVMSRHYRNRKQKQAQNESNIASSATN